MEKTIGRYTKIGCAVAAGMLIIQCQTALAGWTGLVNAATGVGWASSSVRGVKYVSGYKTNVATTANNVTAPSATVALANDAALAYSTLPASPGAASSSTYARVKTDVGLVLQGTVFAAPGDSTDNPELRGRLGASFTPAGGCSMLTVNSMLEGGVAGFVGNSGVINVDTSAWSGTALWIRGFEIDPVLLAGTTVANSIEFLKSNGRWLFETLLLGPYDFSAINGNCVLKIPFTLGSGQLNHLILVANVLAESDPFTITCPTDVVFTCSGPADYPVTTTGGCGNVTLSYSRPASSILVNEAPVDVTVTATDQAGNTATYTDQNGNPATCPPFKASRTGALVFDGFYSPVGAEGTDCNKVFKNSELTKLGQVIPIKFKTFCNGINYSATVPTYEIEKCSDPNKGIVKTGSFTFVSNEWHGQFDTGEQGLGITTGIYIIRVLLQDGTTKQIAVKLK